MSFTVSVDSDAVVDGIVDRSPDGDGVLLAGDTISVAGDIVVISSGSGGYDYVGYPGVDIGSVSVVNGATIVSRGFARFAVPGFIPLSAVLSLYIGTIEAESGKTLFDLTVRAGSDVLPAAGVGDADPEAVFGATYPTSIGTISGLASGTTRTIAVPASAVNRAGFTDIRIAASSEGASYGGVVPISGVTLSVVMAQDVAVDAGLESSDGTGRAGLSEGSETGSELETADGGGRGDLAIGSGTADMGSGDADA